MSEPVAWMQTAPTGRTAPWEHPLTEDDRAGGWTERALVYADDLDAAEARIKVLTEALTKLRKHLVVMGRYEPQSIMIEHIDAALASLEPK